MVAVVFCLTVYALGISAKSFGARSYRYHVTYQAQEIRGATTTIGDFRFSAHHSLTIEEVIAEAKAMVVSKYVTIQNVQRID